MKLTSNHDKQVSDLKFVFWLLNDSVFKLNARCVTASNVYYLGTVECFSGEMKRHQQP